MNPTVQAAIDRTSRRANAEIEDYKNAVTLELCSLTQSTIAYIATINPMQNVLTMVGWSKSAMANCALIDKPIVYKLEDTGMWGDAVRERKAVITNDYKNLEKPTKKGYPMGHVNVRRHMNLPLFDGTKIALVAGVGNKVGEYSQDDAIALEQYLKAIWPVFKAKLA